MTELDATETTGTEVRRPRPLTERQARVLDFIREHITKYGWAPTLREIGLEMGITSTNGVSDHLRALERKGHISRGNMLSRGIKVLGAAVTFGEAPEIVDSCVYFAQSIQSLRIKIGFTDEPKRLFFKLKRETGEQVILLLRLPGGRSLEQALHQRFADEWIEGEWFLPSQRLILAINRLQRCTSPEEIRRAMEHA